MRPTLSSHPNTSTSARADRPAPRRAGGTVLPSGSLVPSPFPAFMDGAWPNVLDRIAQLGVYDAYSGGEGKGKERGPNHVRAPSG